MLTAVLLLVFFTLLRQSRRIKYTPKIRWQKEYEVNCRIKLAFFRKAAGFIRQLITMQKE
ncbi:hypothetical protein DW042_05530 [Bacteroides xylanisolvens]|uniref:Uncharacterized protein n=1 Tax=Bacteroides xylanisolvens TaxID=371601 RepID=A0A415HY99_9BACE|nr:hypothetical protein DW042_05530 [Bacteroides xylanisolvens]